MKRNLLLLTAIAIVLTSFIAQADLTSSAYRRERSATPCRHRFCLRRQQSG